MRMSFAIGSVVLGFSALASAQPGSADPSSPVASVAPASSVDSGVVDDAASPGAFLSPSALTEPAGTVTASLGIGVDTSFNDSEMTHVGLSYSLTNEITVSGALLLPTESDVHVGTLSAKVQVLRSGRWRGALAGMLLVAGTTGDSEEAGLVGGAVTYCLDDACNSYAPGDLALGIEHSSGSGAPFLISGSVVAQVAPHIKLVGEILTGFQAGSDSSGSGGSEFIAFYGARVTQKNVALNVGFIKPFGDNIGVDGPGALFATATARFVP